MKKLIPAILGIWAVMTCSHAATAKSMDQAGFNPGVSADSPASQGFPVGHPVGCGCPACVAARAALMSGQS